MSGRGKRPVGKSGKGRGPAPKPEKQQGRRSGRHGGRGSGSTRRGVNDPQGRFADGDARGRFGNDGRGRTGGERRGPGDRGFRGPGGRRPGFDDDRSGSRGGRRPEGGAERRGPRRREDGGAVCVIERSGRFTVANPFFSPGEPRVIGRSAAAAGIEPGELVLVVPEDAFGGSWRVVQRLGDPDVPANVIAALLVERDLSRIHDDATLAAAADAVTLPDSAARRDLTAIPTFTIDPATAKDFDDAISAEEGPDGAVIRVHIADVTSFVPEGGVIDRAGRARATSTYVPGLVAPMLPPQLADDACSLVPGADRRAVTVEMVVADGRCLRAEVYRSTIRSDMRLDYDGVDAIFEGRAQAEDPWAGPLSIARRVARELIEQRPQALELDIPEPEFEFDPSGRVTSQRESQHTESHRLIEQLMVLANEQVARILDDAGAPGLFRVHEQPNPDRAEELVDKLASLGIPVPPVPEAMGPAEAAALVAECSRIIAEAVARAGRGHLALPILVLRSLKQASYSPQNLGHAGLGLSHYCHFTSPIRRYPDIVCHRAILALAARGRATIGPDVDPVGGVRSDLDDPGGDLDRRGPRSPGLRDDRPGGRNADRDDKDDPLSELAGHCSDQERTSMAVEREADRIAKAFLLRDLLREGGHGKVWRGEVTSIIPAGLFVNFGGGFEGLVPLRTLRGDWWDRNPEGTMLMGEGTGALLHIGDPAEVVVDRVDVTTGRVDLVARAIGGDL